MHIAGATGGLWFSSWLFLAVRCGRQFPLAVLWVLWVSEVCFTTRLLLSSTVMDRCSGRAGLMQFLIGEGPLMWTKSTVTGLWAREELEMDMSSSLFELWINATTPVRLLLVASWESLLDRLGLASPRSISDVRMSICWTTFTDRKKYKFCNYLHILVILNIQTFLHGKSCRSPKRSHDWTSSFLPLHYYIQTWRIQMCHTMLGANDIHNHIELTEAFCFTKKKLKVKYVFMLPSKHNFSF